MLGERLRLVRKSVWQPRGGVLVRSTKPG